MDLEKFQRESSRTTHSSASREKLNALLNDYHKEYHSKTAIKNKSQEFVFEAKFRKHRRNKLNILIKCLAHGLYYCNGLNLLPCDSDILLNVPPWKYEKPTQKLNSKEFVIEPDWNIY